MKLNLILKKRSVVFVFSGLFAVFIFSLSVYGAHDVESWPDKFSNYDEMQQILSTRGKIKVIVKLDVPGIKELTATSISVRRAKMQKGVSLNRTKADTALNDAIASAAHTVLENLEDARFRVSHIYSYIPYMALEVSEEAFAILETLPGVLYIQRNKSYKVVEPAMEKKETKDSSLTGISKPMLVDSVSIIGADIAHNMGYTGMGYYVAVLDTGIRRTHNFFNGKRIVEACFSTGTNGNGECPNGTTRMTGDGSAVHHPSKYMKWDHGTRVAGIAAGDNGTLFGVARDANLIAVQVSHKENGDCSSIPGTQPCVRFYQADVLAGLDYVFGLHGTYIDWNKNGTLESDEIIKIAVVNLSLGEEYSNTSCNNDSRAASMSNLEAIGIPTVVASGNNSLCGYISVPACVSTAVAVGATTKNDTVEPNTNWHETMLELLAPGKYISTAAGSSDSNIDVISSTSAATPHVAGAWALLKQAKPNASVRYYREALRAKGVLISPPSNCAQAITPKPRIQVDEAILATEPILTTPDNGEKWECGEIKEITWFPGNVSGTVKLVLRRQNGSTEGVIADNINANACFYSWEVGTLKNGSTVFGTDCIVRLEDMKGNVLDDSDVPFTIFGVRVTSPNGGESWKLNSIQNITWGAGGITGKVKLVLWKNGKHIGRIVSGLAPDSSPYQWTVGNYFKGTADPGTGYTIRARVEGTEIYDDSNGSFKIFEKPPYVYFDDFNRSNDTNLDGDPLSGNPNVTWNAYNAQVVSNKARPNSNIDSITKADILMDVNGYISTIIEADALVKEPYRTFYMGFPNIENGNFGNYGFTLWLEVDDTGKWGIKTRAYGVTNTLRSGYFPGWIPNTSNHYELDCHILPRTVDFYFNGQQVASGIYVSTPVSLPRIGFQIKRWSGKLGPWQACVDNFKVTLEFE